jgi:hypothetical protein
MKFVCRPAVVRGVRFRSRLEARWAAFFEGLGIRWAYEPVDFADWVPDFEISWKCGHSECPSGHRLFVECKPYRSLDEFVGHPAAEDFYGDRYGGDGVLLVGLDPSVAHADFAHGSGSAEYYGMALWNFFWGSRADWAWIAAGNEVQWRPA